MSEVPDRRSINGWENNWGLTDDDRTLMNNFADWIGDTYQSDRLTMYPGYLNGDKVVIVGRADRNLRDIQPGSVDSIRLAPLAILFTSGLEEIVTEPDEVVGPEAGTVSE